MRDRRLNRVATLALFAAAGCGLLDQATGVQSTSRRQSAIRQQENERREAFLTNGDSSAIRWLLAHRVREGMKVDEVNRILGQDGERELSDGFIKTGPGNFQLDDVTLRWGPDSRGRSYFLVFREGKLVNFDHTAYGGDPDE